ncbi:tetratricopeptide repeat protein [Notoacmeibacter sp. MSK16QG-6]|uniref:tetratricopeptide repeat protein n=1 Tax=Notoacmeibacter sp. MSK16QG-6 TaxID=2957982 RepID=UPI00209FBA63|nr:sel1 repeat family protein [Notoacmeibacter sp. MSK16QG-6]MCP1200830.1 sel1 repeat family protein [Notoacmeibacter sp. MSK16QG-6]
MKKFLLAHAVFGAFIFVAQPAAANEQPQQDPWQLDAGSQQQNEFGTLNPDEMTLNRAIENATRGEVDMMTCAQGYIMTKMGNHVDARTIFRKCAEAGYTGTMTWMSYMEENGFGRSDIDPESAAKWDRQAADIGDPIAQLNYGLDLLRGRGVAPDPEAGQRWVDRAAAAGEPAAIELQKSDYDYRAVTPDADEGRYDKNLF